MKSTVRVLLIIAAITTTLQISGCRQFTRDADCAIYGAVLLQFQSDHSGTLVTAASESQSVSTMTEQSGFFVIAGLAPGVYEVTVSRNGWYVPDGYPTNQQVVLTEGQSVTDIDFYLESDALPPAPPE